MFSYHDIVIPGLKLAKFHQIHISFSPTYTRFIYFIFHALPIEYMKRIYRTAYISKIHFTLVRDKSYMFIMYY